MIIHPQKVEVSWNINNKKHYESLGYFFTKYRDHFYIDVLDLSTQSKSIVKCLCDYCGKEHQVAFKFINPNRLVKHRSELKIVCGSHNSCFQSKVKDINMEKYGVVSASCLQEIKNKSKETCIKKYGAKSPTLNSNIKMEVKQTNLKKFGTENAFQSEAIKKKIKEINFKKYGTENVQALKSTKDKIKQTNLLKYGVGCSVQYKKIKDRIKANNIRDYGVEFSIQRPSVLEKIKNTNLKRYGVENAIQSDYSKNKVKQTNLKKYGVENAIQSEYAKEKAKQTNLKKYGVEKPFQSKDIRKKAAQTVLSRYGVSNPFKLNIEARIIKARNTLHRNGTGPCSKQQKYLHNLLGGELNYPVEKCLLDIAYPDKKIYIEYDGSGHGYIDKYYGSADVFNKKQIARKVFLQNKGWKIIRYITTKDVLLKEIKLIILFYSCIEYLINSNHSWIEINIDENKIKCAEYTVDIEEK